MPIRLSLTRFLNLGGLLLCLLAVFSGVTHSQVIPDIEVFVGDTTASSGEQNTAISIYMKNYHHTVAGYTLWVMLSQPNILEFKTQLQMIEYQRFWRYTAFAPSNPDSAIDSVEVSLYWVCQQWSGPNCIDSTQLLGYYHCDQYSGDDCIDSTFIPGYDAVHIDIQEAYVGNIDTTGTLTSGWEKVETRSIGGYGQDLLITAIANTPTPPNTPGIPIQYGALPLIKIKGDVFDIAPEDTNRVVDIRIEYNILDFFGFSDPGGNSIGIITETITDTLYYDCLEWIIPDVTCAWWVRTDDPLEADSMRIIQYLHGYLDTIMVKVYDGSLIVLSGTCGDVSSTISGEPDDLVNILDIIYLINYKFKGGPAPHYLPMADVNCDITVNILDILKVINFKFKQGPPLECCPGLWP